MEEREKHEATRAQRANENIQVRVENGLWSQKETSLATDNNMEEIRRNTGEDYIKTVLEDGQENEDKHQHQVGGDGV